MLKFTCCHFSMTPPWSREAEVAEVDGDGPSGGHVEQTSASGAGSSSSSWSPAACSNVVRTRDETPKLGHHLTVDVHGEVMPAPDVAAGGRGLQSRVGAVNTIVSCQGCGQSQFSPRSPSSGLCAGCWDGQRSGRQYTSFECGVYYQTRP